jgi:hypothetical protein
MAFHGEFSPVLAKHSKSFNLIDTLSVRNFEPMQDATFKFRNDNVHYHSRSRLIGDCKCNQDTVSIKLAWSIIMRMS